MIINISETAFRQLLVGQSNLFMFHAAQRRLLWPSLVSNSPLWHWCNTCPAKSG